MNPKLEALFARRSVRRYTKEEVSEEAVRDLLEAAMAAPSAVAKDPWHFLVVRDQATRDGMADGLPNGQMLRQSPVAFLVCGDLDVAHDNLESYMIQDCSAAIENLLLAASILDLGAVWLGIHPRADRVAYIRKRFNLSENIVPVSAIALGHPADSPPARTRYDESKVHQEKW